MLNNKKKKLWMLPYKKGSVSAKYLAQSLMILSIRRGVISRFKPSPDNLIINWGCSVGNWPPHVTGACINSPVAVGRATDKLLSLMHMDRLEVSIPTFTEYVEEVDKFPVLCRTILSGHSGQGIVMANSEEELVDAPLYVQYVKKQEEYRVHVFNGEVIHKQRKARNRDIPDEDVNWQIRNHSNGFIFQLNGFDIPEQVEEEAVKAVKALALDFGAVDVIWNAHEEKAYVLEVNTAPGLEGTTLEKYTEAFNGIL